MEAEAVVGGFKGFAVVFVVGLVGLGALEDFEGLEDWTI